MNFIYEFMREMMMFIKYDDVVDISLELPLAIPEILNRLL